MVRRRGQQNSPLVTAECQDARNYQSRFPPKLPLYANVHQPVPLAGGYPNRDQVSEPASTRVREFRRVPIKVVISSQNRNFPGRSGPGQMYLASPYTVAASAVAGYIVEYEPSEKRELVGA